jgi:GNAT superfamily N-acetyltransferase
MAPRPIQHRRARRTDFEAVCALLSAGGVTVPEADRATLRRFRRLVADLGSDVYLALVDERVVGIVQVTYTRHLLGQEARLALLAVMPEQRRHGIGRSLAGLAAARARRRGCARVCCALHGSASEATAFLTALGWRASGAQVEFDLVESAQ